MSIINSTIPEFTLQAYHQDSFIPLSHHDVLGKWAVFFFYPADFSFVCPTELSDLAEAYDELQAMGVEVYSVSTDTHFVHKAWFDASESIQQIRYPMVRWRSPAGKLSRHDSAYMTKIQA